MAAGHRSAGKPEMLLHTWSGIVQAAQCVQSHPTCPREALQVWLFVWLPAQLYILSQA